MKKNYQSLPDRHKAMLPDYPGHIDECRAAVNVNYELIKTIVGNAAGFLQNSDVSDFVSDCVCK